ncbi:Capsule biosynthesis protein CapA [Stylophora pistillata]|uniref:Capsule biosynthesis protein CapA n=1 Tax=Stylophora pistillata TaxID=50429 RepID=A0A2B4SPZ4_STYPI|nr:Capsule biosynthesis protein CapA [Stylophora pistillata]
MRWPTRRLVDLTNASKSEGRRVGDHVSLIFVGDIYFAGPVKYYVEHKHNTYNDSFNEVAPYIREADISVCNLESPFVNEDVYTHKYKGEKSVLLNSNKDAASALRFAGFNAITLANNHLNDFGAEGANFTAEVLKEIGIPYFGISFGDYLSSQEPLIIKRKGIAFGFLGYCDSPSVFKNCSQMRMLFTSGPAIYRDDVATRDINELKAKVDVIVVLMHYGEETYLRPIPYQLHINKHLMSLGVDIIIGAHPHVVQGHCVNHNKLIEDSLGNFLFHPVPYKRGSNPVTKGVVGATYLPLKVKLDHKTKRLHPEPVKNSKWIHVCGDEDVKCQCRNEIIATRKAVKKRLR